MRSYKIRVRMSHFLLSFTFSTICLISFFSHCQTVWNPDNTAKHGHVNVLWPDGFKKELTVTEMFDLRYFLQYVTPWLDATVPIVFVQVAMKLYVYNLGGGGVSHPEVLLAQGKPPSEITSVHFISEKMNNKRCVEILDELPNAASVAFDVLGFSETPDLGIPYRVYPNVRNLTVQTHKSLFAELNEDQQREFLIKCTLLIRRCERLFPKLRTMTLKLPQAPGLQVAVLSIIQSNTYFRGVSWLLMGTPENTVCILSNIENHNY